MTTSIITIWHCDANDCALQAPAGTDGWEGAVHTHGCPAHAGDIAAHHARITNDTRGRGTAATTTWFLRCDCGWTPNPPYATHNYAKLARAHLAHVKTATSREADR